MKKFINYILIGLNIFSLVGCSHIEDSIGAENYSITTITDKEILSSGSSYIALGFISNYKYVKSTYEGYAKASKLSGVKLLSTINNDDSDVEYNIKLNVTSGNCVLAIVSNNEIIKKVEANKDETFSLPFTSKQKLKIVGESANFILEYTVY